MGEPTESCIFARVAIASAVAERLRTVVLDLTAVFSFHEGKVFSR